MITFQRFLQERFAIAVDSPMGHGYLTKGLDIIDNRKRAKKFKTDIKAMKFLNKKQLFNPAWHYRAEE
jgi:hypothetical protein